MIQRSTSTGAGAGDRQGDRGNPAGAGQAGRGLRTTRYARPQRAVRTLGFRPPGLRKGFWSHPATEAQKTSLPSGPIPLTTRIHWAWEEHLGLEVEAVSVYEYSDRLERMDNNEFGVFTWGWCADYPDPQNFLDFLFHSDSHLNRFNYTNETVDRLLNEAAVESKGTRRTILYQRAEKTILDDWVAVPLWHDRQFLLVRPYVKGFVPTPIGVPQLQNISIERQP